MAYFSKYNGKIAIFYIKLKSNVKLNGEFSDFVQVLADCILRFRFAGNLLVHDLFAPSVAISQFFLFQESKSITL